MVVSEVFNLILWYIEHFLWNWSWINAIETHLWNVNIRLGNGLVQACHALLSEPIFTQIHVTG